MTTDGSNTSADYNVTVAVPSSEPDGIYWASFDMGGVATLEFELILNDDTYTMKRLAGTLGAGENLFAGTYAIEGNTIMFSQISGSAIGNAMIVLGDNRWTIDGQLMVHSQQGFLQQY